MGEIAKQIRSDLPEEILELDTRVSSLSEGIVVAQSDDGDIQYDCEYIVIASDPKNASVLINSVIKQNDKNFTIPAGRSSLCLYYSIKGPPPISEPILILNGENVLSDTEISDESKISINNICFPSSVSSSYAPDGMSLASVTVVGSFTNNLTTEQIERSVSKQLVDWWGEEALQWNFIKMYCIPYAQPAQYIPYPIKGCSEQLSEKILVCGDHRGGATLNGAIASGRRAARALNAKRTYAVANLKSSAEKSSLLLKDIPIREE